MARAFPDVMAGDIFLVRLHAPAPWGRWAHTAIAVNHFSIVVPFMLGVALFTDLIREGGLPQLGAVAFELVHVEA